MLVLRPQPGAAETARRIMGMGHEAVVAPLFEVRPLEWAAPDAADFDAVLMTSANAARHGGPQLGAFTALPCYAVGEATAEAARLAGFSDVRTGPSDGPAVVRMMQKDEVSLGLHLSGREHVPIDAPITARRAVYASDAVDILPGGAAAALKSGAVALLHSPRAASTFAELIDEAGLERGSITVAAISRAAADAAGPSWRAKAAAEQPRDEALLELAAKLCNNGSMGMGG